MHRQLILLFVLTIFCQTQNLIYNPIIGSNMVLQRDSPHTKIWGRSAQQSGTIKVDFSSPNNPGWSKTVSIVNGHWMLPIPNVKASGPYNVEITELNTNKTQRFTNVYFGDVFLCSGQSNMQWPLSAIFNASEEIADARNYPLIRLFSVERVASKDPLDAVKGAWRVTDPKAASSFSAVCYIFGRNLFKRLDGKVPIGLIQSAWGGTIIEAWSSPDALRACGTERRSEKQQNPNLPSHLWNAMIYPLLNFNIKGALWYQGEANARKAELYKCQFPEMIKDWRKKFGVGDFHFYFVQLSAYTGIDFAELRWAQTWALKLDNTGMATAVDLGDPEGGIHPRNKQPISERLENIASNQIYGRKELPVTGPLPQAVKVSNLGNDYTFEIAFSHAAEKLKLRGTAFCQKCCNDTGFIEVQQADSLQWIKTKFSKLEENKVIANAMGLSKKPIAIRYLWSKYPECVIANAKNNLPAPPFVRQL